jgi:hypothetical protein
LDNECIGVQFPSNGKRLSLLHTVKTEPLAHTASSFNKARGQGREFDHSSPSYEEVKNAWSYSCIPPYVFVVCLTKHSDNFIFALVI